MQAGLPKDAEAQFQKLIDNHGSAVTVYWALAHLGLARAYRKTARKRSPPKRIAFFSDYGKMPILMFRYCGKPAPNKNRCPSQHDNRSRRFRTRFWMRECSGKERTAKKMENRMGFRKAATRIQEKQRATAVLASKKKRPARLFVLLPDPDRRTPDRRT